MSDLTGKVALITGASAGIGLEVARQMAAKGARIALVARGREALDRAVAEIGADRARAYSVDLGDLVATAALPAQVVADMGRLDIVVNNAGAHRRGEFTAHSPADLASMVTINLTSPVALSRAALDHLPRGGVIVNVASLAGYVPLPGSATYSATKVGLRFLSVAMNQELEGRGIRVAVVSPGPVDTGFLADIESVSALTFSQPMSSAEDVARAVVAALDPGPDDVAVPAPSGRLATLAYLFPWFASRIRPRLVARGEAAKKAYMAQKRGSGA